MPTRFPFPDHLNNRIEDGAIGIDAEAEVRRILDGRPSVIVSTDKPQKKTNLKTWAIMSEALARDYVQVLAVPIGSGSRIVYRMRQGGQPPQQ